MREIGKLFQRDRRYWMVLAAVMLVFVVYWLTFLAQSVSAYQAIWAENSRKMEALRGQQEAVNEADGDKEREELLHREQAELMRDSANAFADFRMRVKGRADLLTGVAVVLLWGFQLARWTVQSGKGGIEAEERLPIRRSSFVTYDIFCGAISFGALFLAENVVYGIVRNGLGESFKKELFAAFGYSFSDYVEVMLMCFIAYCLAVLGRQVSRTVLGCVFFTVLHCLIIIELDSLGLYRVFDVLGRIWPLSLLASGIWLGIVYSLITCICICALCYFFRGRRDIAAGNGAFVFRGIHYYVLAAVFVSFLYVSLWIGDTHRIRLMNGAAAVRALLAAVVVTVLSHVLLRRKIV